MQKEWHIAVAELGVDIGHLGTQRKVVISEVQRVKKIIERADVKDVGRWLAPVNV